MGMRISAEAQRVSIAQSELHSLITKFAADHDLSPVELLQALTTAAQSELKYMLRAERNPEHPDRPAGLDYSDD